MGSSSQSLIPGPGICLKRDRRGRSAGGLREGAGCARASCAGHGRRGGEERVHAADGAGNLGELLRLRRVFANPKSAPAAPLACAGVAPISLSSTSLSGYQSQVARADRYHNSCVIDQGAGGGTGGGCRRAMTEDSVSSGFLRSLEPPLHPHRRSKRVVDLVADRSVVVAHVRNNRQLSRQSDGEVRADCRTANIPRLRFAAADD